MKSFRGLVTLVIILISCHPVLVAQDEWRCMDVKTIAANDSLAKVLAMYWRFHPTFLSFQQSKWNRQAGMQPTQFIWPLSVDPAYGEDVPNYYILSYYTDRTPDDTTTVTDYHCGNRSYEGHGGYDITLFPFMWHMMEQQYVAVRAAEDGVVTYAFDQAMADYNCTGCQDQSYTSNKIFILHADLKSSSYHHLRSNSMLVDSGDVVEAGDIIAYVASSGCSYAPHLHFQVYDEQGNTIEPSIGECSDQTESLWVDPVSYWVPGINRIMCHTAYPELLESTNTKYCVEEELMFPGNSFEPGDPIFFGIAIRDIQPNDTIFMWVSAPGGEVILATHFAWIHDPVAATYWVCESQLSEDTAEGTYKIKVLFHGAYYYHFFDVGCPDQLILFGYQVDIEKYIADQAIVTSRGMIGAQRLGLQANHEIRLVPGFYIPYGGTLKTDLRACNFTW